MKLQLLQTSNDWSFSFFPSAWERNCIKLMLLLKVILERSVFSWLLALNSSVFYFFVMQFFCQSAFLFHRHNRTSRVFLEHVNFSFICDSLAICRGFETEQCRVFFLKDMSVKSHSNNKRRDGLHNRLILHGLSAVLIVQPCRVSAQVKRWKDKHYHAHIIVEGMDNWHACHRCPEVSRLMTAKLHLAPGMCRGQSQTSEHQTALSSVDLIALDMGFIGSPWAKRRQEAKAEPDCLSCISFSFVSHALRRRLLIERRCYVIRFTHSLKD